MPDVFHEMSAKGLGMTTVVEADGRLAGILTDGDLRRLMEKHRGAVLEMCAADGMTKTPQTIGPHVLASEALNLMEKKKITFPIVNAAVILGADKVYEFHDWKLACGGTKMYNMVNDGAAREFSYSPLTCKIVGNR